MELENTQNNVLAKLPMLKLGEYEMWEIRIKQYFQIHDYELWDEAIVNGNSGCGTIKLQAPESGNEATKKTQKALLKQQYENFNASSLSHHLILSLQASSKLVSSASSINNINTVNPEVSTGTTKVNTASTEISTASFSDATLRARSSIRELVGRSSLMEVILLDMINQRAMYAINGARFDWSDMAEEEIQANMALMAFSDSENLEVLFLRIALLKRSVGHKEYLMGLLRTELEKVKEEMRGLNLRLQSLEEFKQPEVNEYGSRDSSVKPTTGCDIDVVIDWKEKFFCSANQVREEDIRKLDEYNDAPIIEVLKEFVKPEKPVRRSVSCPNVNKHMAPRAVLMKTGLKIVNTARPVNTGRPFNTARSFNTVRPSYTAHPKSTVHCARPRTYFQNQAQSTVQRPFYKKTALTKRSYNQNVNTGRQNVNTDRARGFNAVKPSTCWVWKPNKPNGASLVFNKYNYIDADWQIKSVMAWSPKIN
ncbi:hypothetical protein Tco_0687820 [Tanacetum coccineum]